MHCTFEQKVESLIERYKFMEEQFRRESCLTLKRLPMFENNTEEMNTFVRIILNEENEINPYKVAAEFIDENDEIGEVFLDFSGQSKLLLWPNQFLIIRGQKDNGIFRVIGQYPDIQKPALPEFSPKQVENHFSVHFYSGPYMPETSSRLIGLGNFIEILLFRYNWETHNKISTKFGYFEWTIYLKGQ